MAVTPRQVFDQFSQHLELLTAPRDADIEDQFFDRKEVPRPRPSGAVNGNQLRELREEVVECVSAFANSNPQGGLLVIGISKTGEVRGVNHLTDDQRNSLTNLSQMLVNHAAIVRMVDCVDSGDGPNRLILVYVPYTHDAICETHENRPRAWKRAGAQNLLLCDRDREQLRRNKRIVDYESRLAGDLRTEDLDDALLKEVRDTWPELAQVDRRDDDLLLQLGGAEREGAGLAFTTVGLLFFGANPQRLFSSARIRLLRFDCKHADPNRGLPTLEREFTGSVTKQLRDFRVFIRESGLFKVYQTRRPDSGFVEEPEFPPIVIDEAVVNAVAHRDYACTWPIECEYYQDAFIVRNAGTLLQRNATVPAHFQLDQQALVSTPRNPKLMGWLKKMRDGTGAAFVRELSEGTRRMTEEMRSLGLPAPIYDVSDSETKVTLLSEPERRGSKARSGTAQSTEYANLYPVQFKSPDGRIDHLVQRDGRQAFLNALRDCLKAADWFIDRLSHGVLTAHRRGNAVALPRDVTSVVRLFPAYSFAVREYAGRSYLVIDYRLEVKNVISARQLLAEATRLRLDGRTATVRVGNAWERARIVQCGNEWTTAHVFDFHSERQVDSGQVIPDLSTIEVAGLLEARRVRFDIHSAIKRESLATEAGAARIRAERTQNVVEYLLQDVFPIVIGGREAALLAKPLPLLHEPGHLDCLEVRTLPEPVVEFGRRQETSDIREGITKFGSYEHEPKDVEVVPIVDESMRNAMAGLIERLKAGKFKYRGSERTFGIRFSYGSIVGVPRAAEVESTCKRLISEHPEWSGDRSLRRIFLVHTPEAGYASDDESSPYFRTKRLLLEHGIPCQMVDSPTLQNPDWKDLNLALNVVAKCGLTPWVLPEGIPDADCFIGLSYTQHRSNVASRLMGYANVFNEYGRWLFYSANAQTFGYDERTAKLGDLVAATLERLKLSETPHVYFHYSARFSKEDRWAIVDAARRIRPNGTYSFVWINTHHLVRLYDSRPEGDGSLQRGGFVVTSPNQIYISTTGSNPFRRTLGTPLMLEVNIWRSSPRGEARSPIDLRALAVQILALTKLNWSSTDALTGEPITTKYAGDIAYLTAAFLRQGGTFALHPSLESTPWFL